jgi:hypothetical protein
LTFHPPKKVAPPPIRVEFFVGVEIVCKGYQKEDSFVLISNMCITLASKSAQIFFPKKGFFAKFFMSLNSNPGAFIKVH